MKNRTAIPHVTLTTNKAPPPTPKRRDSDVHRTATNFKEQNNISVLNSHVYKLYILLISASVFQDTYMQSVEVFKILNFN